MRRVRVAAGAGWVITEHVRTFSADRFRGYAPEIMRSERELDDLPHVLAQMLML